MTLSPYVPLEASSLLTQGRWLAEAGVCVCVFMFGNRCIPPYVRSTAQRRRMEESLGWGSEKKNGIKRRLFLLCASCSTTRSKQGSSKNPTGGCCSLSSKKRRCMAWGKARSIPTSMICSHPPPPSPFLRARASSSSCPPPRAAIIHHIIPAEAHPSPSP